MGGAVEFTVALRAAISVTDACLITENVGNGQFRWWDLFGRGGVELNVATNSSMSVATHPIKPLVDWTDNGGHHVADGCIDDCNCNEVSDPDDVADGTWYELCDGDGLVPDECEIEQRRRRLDRRLRLASRTRTATACRTTAIPTAPRQRHRRWRRGPLWLGR